MADDPHGVARLGDLRLVLAMGIQHTHPRLGWRTPLRSLPFPCGATVVAQSQAAVRASCMILFRPRPRLPRIPIARLGRVLRYCFVCRGAVSALSTSWVDPWPTADVPQELKLAMPPREVTWPRRRCRRRCKCGCKKRPGRLTPRPDCGRGVGPGCCWSKETCHKCSWELVDQDATTLAIAERKEDREVIMPQWTT